MDVTTTSTRIGKFDARFFHMVFEVSAKINSNEEGDPILPQAVPLFEPEYCFLYCSMGQSNDQLSLHTIGGVWAREGPLRPHQHRRVQPGRQRVLERRRGRLHQASQLRPILPRVQVGVLGLKEIYTLRERRRPGLPFIEHFSRKREE